MVGLRASVSCRVEKKWENVKIGTGGALQKGRKGILGKREDFALFFVAARRLWTAEDAPARVARFFGQYPRWVHSATLTSNILLIIRCV